MTTASIGLNVCVDLTSTYSKVSYRLDVVFRNLYSDLYSIPTPPPRLAERHSPISYIAVTWWS